MHKYSLSFIRSSAILFFTYIMASIIFPYTTFRWDVDFLLTKQHLLHVDYYRLAFYAHIFSSLFVLCSGAFLFSGYILKKHPALHRRLGKIYVGLLLLVSAPSGLVMGFHANGGWMAQLSFFILTPLWWWFTYQGYVTARNKKFKAHKKWMMRSYALTLSAISLRVYQMLLGSFFMIDPMVQYVLVSWVSWLGNLAFIELYMWKKGTAAARSANGHLRVGGTSAMQLRL
ncbi:MAG: DUF2306 domain-containing protein [Bacteroidota bacterium]